MSQFQCSYPGPELEPLERGSSSGFFDGYTAEPECESVGDAETCEPGVSYGNVEPPARVGRLVTHRISCRDVGAVAEFGPGGAVVRRQWPLIPHAGGGTRGTITGFSGSSRRRLLEKITRIAWDGDAFFVSLTYHSADTGSPVDWKRDLLALRKRIERRWGSRVLGVLWREEFQDRGVVHFHLVIFWRRWQWRGRWISCAPRVGQFRETFINERGRGSRYVGKRGFWEWVSAAWSEIVGARVLGASAVDVDHYRYGVHVERVHSKSGSALRRLTRYLAKYVAKEQTLPLLIPETGEIVEQSGRIWGEWWDVPYKSLGWVRLPYGSFVRYLGRLREWGGDSSRYLADLTAGRGGCVVLGEGDALQRLASDLPAGMHSMVQTVELHPDYGPLLGEVGFSLPAEDLEELRGREVSSEDIRRRWWRASD